MSLNTIRLQPCMVADFYGNSLVESSSASTATPLPSLAVLGGNAKRILILVTHPETRFLPDSELELLTSVLAACKLGLTDVAVVNNATASPELIANFLQENARHVMLFNIDPLAIDLPISFPHFQVQPFDERIYLAAPSLSAIGQDKTLKLKLWNALKSFFSL